ncbi:MAG: ATP synthase F1 subunit delta [Thermoleophilaceae bacterium]
MEEIAQVYARSLFQVAMEHDSLDTIHDQLGEIADALSKNRDLQIFFFSPYFSSEEKKQGIDRIIDGGDEHLVRFLELLAEKHRLPVLFRIRRAFDDLWAEENKLLEVEVTSAVKLDPSTVEAIGKRIEEQTGRRIEMSEKVDDNLIGGLVLKVGNMVLDASIKNRLERLRKQVATAA